MKQGRFFAVFFVAFSGFIVVGLEAVIGYRGAVKE